MSDPYEGPIDDGSSDGSFFTNTDDGAIDIGDLPDPDGGAIDIGDLPDPDDGAIDIGDLPDPDDGAIDIGDLPDPNDGVIDIGDLPDPNDGAIDIGDLPDPNDGAIDIGDLPDPDDGAIDERLSPLGKSDAWGQGWDSATNDTMDRPPQPGERKLTPEQADDYNKGFRAGQEWREKQEDEGRPGIRPDDGKVDKENEDLTGEILDQIAEMQGKGHPPHGHHEPHEVKGSLPDLPAGRTPPPRTPPPRTR
ncbi:hypothetical protein ACLQ2Q_15910 [Microbacterium sp. DT81.1]|uniref:hypothetical protein n=1 Tax=Microbacterium sp. DT81.1 TaxID=3393413 RepID=UPI003CF160D2